MVWDDKELLFRVIEERLEQKDSENIWEEYFCKEVDGIPVKDYLINNVLPKPRDLIFLVGMSLENEQNRNHTIIEENDIKDAVEKYSEFAFQTLVTELQTEFPEIENFLLDLLGENSIVDEQKLLNSASKFNIEGERCKELIELLCQMLFLGMEIKDNSFEYCYDIDKYKKYKILSNKVAQSEGTKRYKIHPAFYASLLIEQ